MLGHDRPTELQRLRLRERLVHEDFPEASFDLVHTRSLLANLPEREDVLAEIARWLTSGGWAVIEEPAMVLHDSSPYLAFRRLFAAYEEALALSHGADVRWPRRLPAVMNAAGLHEVGMALTPQLVGDGGPAEEIWRTALDQAREGMLELRLLTAEEFAAGTALLDDPSFVEVAMLLGSAWGRKPATRE